MSGRVFLDTNVFVYAVGDGASNRGRTAATLIENALARGSGCSSYQVIQEFCNVALRRFRAPFRDADLQSYLRLVFARLHVVESSLPLIQAGLDLVERHRFGWYDALIVAAASGANCGILYTEDLRHGQRLGALRIVNPFL